MPLNIKTNRADKCPICTTSGEIIYRNLADILYQTEGYWNIRKCQNKNCKTFWVDPRTDITDLHKLYASYSSHSIAAPLLQKNIHTSFLKKILNTTRDAVLHKHLGYPQKSASKFSALFNLLSYMAPAWRDTQLVNNFYAPFIENGKLLDVGCGNGSSLLTLAEQGWKHIEGIDFDEKAIEAAKKLGLNASVSDIYSKKYQDNSFDVIIMSHVIEHMPELHKFMNECLRVLKPGGTLIAITPNSNSFGSNYFKKDWRGLEVPRHLQIFTTHSLAKLAKDCNFTDIKAHATVQGVEYILTASRDIKNTNACDQTKSSPRMIKIRRSLFAHIFSFLYLFAKNKSEVIVLNCKKPLL